MFHKLKSVINMLGNHDMCKHILLGGDSMSDKRNTRELLYK